MKNNTTSLGRSSGVAESLFLLVRPSSVVALVMLAVIALVAVSKHYTLLDFAHLGTVWSEHDPAGTWGYDGQFYYQMARNPLAAYQYIDSPSFREQHMFYPLVVGVLSLGQTALIPLMLLLVNVASVAVCVEVAARLLERSDLSPWLSLGVGLYCGQAAGTLFDTAEPFTYALLAVAIWLIVEKRGYTLAAVLMGLACLAREIAILFPIAYACNLFLQRKWRKGLPFVLYGMLPLLVWLVFLRLVYGTSGVTFTQPLEHVPFAGMLAHTDAPRKFSLLCLLILLPTLACWLLAISEGVRHLLRQPRQHWLKQLSPAYLILLANLAMISLMNHHSFDELISCTRIAIGLVLAVTLYGIQMRNKYILWGVQYYALTLPLFVIGTLLQWPSFIG